MPGYDVSTMSTAMAIRNESLARNAHEAAEQEERMLNGGARSRGGRGVQLPGKLYTFGSGDYGRLGHGDNMPQKAAKLVEILRDKSVTKFACGTRHTLALTADGSVYSWGYGGDGQLGHGDLQLQTMPAQIKALHGEHITAIACGEKHSACLTSNGEVFTWGDGSLGQLGLGDFRKQHTPHRVMELQGKMIMRLSCGAFHTAAIADDGGGATSVYTWGQGGSGRLGHDTEHDQPVPQLVRALEGKGIQAVRCFAEHTIALTVPEEGAESGAFDKDSEVRLKQKIQEQQVKLQREAMKAEEAERRLEQSKSSYIESEQNALRLQKQVEALLAERVDLYMKMQALESQLSISTTDRADLDKQLRSLVNIPTKLEEIASQGVRQLAVGEKHILALSDTGDVYAWGTGSAGQLGLGKRRSYPSPQLVWGLMRKGVRQIAAGSAHSLALTYNGHVYSWGSSKAGQLGHGNRKTQVLPKMIEYLNEEGAARSSTVRLIGAGAKHSVAVLGNGELYMWGRPDFGRLGRSKSDALNEPARIDALWRREVAEGHTDRTKALGKQERDRRAARPEARRARDRALLPRHPVRPRRGALPGPGRRRRPAEARHAAALRAGGRAAGEQDAARPVPARAGEGLRAVGAGGPREARGAQARPRDQGRALPEDRLLALAGERARAGGAARAHRPDRQGAGRPRGEPAERAREGQVGARQVAAAGARLAAAGQAGQGDRARHRQAAGHVRAAGARAGAAEPRAHARRHPQARADGVQEVGGADQGAHRRGVGALAAARRDGHRAHRARAARPAHDHRRAARPAADLQRPDRLDLRAGVRVLLERPRRRDRAAEPRHAALQQRRDAQADQLVHGGHPHADAREARRRGRPAAGGRRRRQLRLGRHRASAVSSRGPRVYDPA